MKQIFLMMALIVSFKTWSNPVEVVLNERNVDGGYLGRLSDTDIQQVHTDLDLIRTEDTPNRVNFHYDLVTYKPVCTRYRMVYNRNLCRNYPPRTRPYPRPRPPRTRPRPPRNRPPRTGPRRPGRPGAPRWPRMVEHNYPNNCYERVCVAWENQEVNESFKLKLRFRWLPNVPAGSRELIGVRIIKTGKDSVRYEAFSDQGYDVDVDGRRIIVRD